MHKQGFGTHASPGFSLLGAWVIASASGGALIYPLLILLGSLAISEFAMPLATAFTWFAAPLAGVIGGGVAGLGQWIALRKVYPSAYAWLLVSILSWLAGLVATIGLFFWLRPEGPGYVILLVPVLAGGALSGLVQSVLVRRWVASLGWWVLANASGWALGWVVGLGLAAVSLREQEIAPGLSVAAVGAMHGLWIGFQSGLALLLLSMYLPEQAGPAEEALPPG